MNFEQLYQHPLLSKQELKRIEKAHNKIALKKGTFLLREHQTANSYYILEKGLVRSFVYDYNGIDVTTNFFCNNDIVIEVSSLFQRIPTNESIQALTDCVVWEIEFDVFQELFHDIEGFREWGRAWMSNSLFLFKQRAVYMITHSATQRYISLIDEKPQVLRDAPLKHIASYLGITDTSLSRIRKEIVK